MTSTARSSAHDGSVTSERSFEPSHNSGLASPTDSIYEPGNDVPVGLSDVNNARNRREMLELVNRLHDTGVQTDIDLPMIAVIGNQSAGKSSLIESISGITLPRSSGACTRCPTECKLSHSDAPWKCTIKLHFVTDVTGTPTPVRLVPFGLPITSPSQVEDRIRRAHRAILSPSRDPQIYLRDDHLPNENEVLFSKNYVSLEISGNEVADLSFVDLPGLIASVGRGGNERDIELIKALVTSYIEKPSCVILLTVTCETDFENQGAYHLAKRFDRLGKRTVGVLTKPDRIPLGDEAAWIKIIQNEAEPLANNWYCVKQPSTQVLSSGVTWADARHQEDQFFAVTLPWCSLEPLYQNYLRTSKLTEKLSAILSELIAKRLPEVQDELSNTIQETKRRMNKLPKAPSGDPVGEVFKALNNFSRDLSLRVEGTPGDDLLRTIRTHQQAFRRAIRHTAPNYVPWEGNTGRTDRTFIQEEVLSDDEDDESVDQEPEPKEVEDEGSEYEGSEDFHPNENKPNARSANESGNRLATKRVRADANIIYVDEVLERAESARTRELPDNYPFLVQKAYIEEFTKEWEEPMMLLFDQVYTTLKIDLRKLVEAHFAHMGKGTAKQSVLMIVNDHLDEAATRTKMRIKWLLDVEQVPATLNMRYFSDYKDKFLSHYRMSRQDGTLLSKLKRAEFKVLAGLNEVGILTKAMDLPKLLPPDPMEVALDIMASVRAYFQVAHKRFVDIVPMAIDHEIVLGLRRGLEEALHKGLQITGPDGYNRCKSMVEESRSIATTRQEIQKKMERLQAARQELKRLM